MSFNMNGATVKVTNPDGTNVSGGGGAVTQSGTWTVQPGNTANTTAWKVDGSAVTQPVSGTVTASLAPTAASGGLSTYAGFQTSGAVLTAQVKGSAGRLYGVVCFSADTVANYIRIYNQTGAPASTDGANIIWRGIIPGDASGLGAGFLVEFPNGISCATGIGVRVSQAIADNDTTVLTANKVIVNIQYL